jgi:hypothetical protein
MDVEALGCQIGGWMIARILAGVDHLADRADRLETSSEGKSAVIPDTPRGRGS